MKAKDAHSNQFLPHEVTVEHRRAWNFMAEDTYDYLLRCDKTYLGEHFPDIEYTKNGLTTRHFKPANGDSEDCFCLCDLIEYHLTQGGADPPPIGFGGAVSKQ